MTTLGELSAAIGGTPTDTGIVHGPWPGPQYYKPISPILCPVCRGSGYRCCEYGRDHF